MRALPFLKRNFDNSRLGFLVLAAKAFSWLSMLAAAHDRVPGEDNSLVKPIACSYRYPALQKQPVKGTAEIKWPNTVLGKKALDYKLHGAGLKASSIQG